MRVFWARARAWNKLIHEYILLRSIQSMGAKYTRKKWKRSLRSMEIRFSFSFIPIGEFVLAACSTFTVCFHYEVYVRCINTWWLLMFYCLFVSSADALKMRLFYLLYFWIQHSVSVLSIRWICWFPRQRFIHRFAWNKMKNTSWKC